MAVQIPFPLPSSGFALNSKMRINLDFLVGQFNQFNTGSATWDTVAIGTANNLTGALTFYNASNANYLTFQPGATGANLTFTWPTAYPTPGDGILKSSSVGTMSWLSATGGFLTSTTAGVLSWTGAPAVANAVPLVSTLGAVTFSAISYNLTGASNGLAYVPAGGTQVTTLANGQGVTSMLIGTTAGTPKYVQILGTSNQVLVGINTNDVTFSTPQDIGTGSSVQFSRAKVDAGTYASPGFYFASSTSNTVGLFAEANGSGLNVRAGASAGSTVFAIDSTGLAAATLEMRAPTIRATTATKFSNGAGSIVTLQSLSTSFGDYTLTLPPDDGTSGYVLRTDGAGVLTWVSVSAAGGATTALDNLASVAINTALLPGADNTIDLGSATKDFRTLYVSTSIKNGSTTLATATELGHLTGVTSAIQTQLGTKAPTAGPTFTGTVTIPTPFTVGAVSVTATGTELNYVVGVTSAIQTQLGLKAPLASPTFTGSAVAASLDVQTLLKGKGTATNDSAAAGYIGEYISSVISADTAFPTTNQWGDLTSISLTAGDWDVTGIVWAAGGTTVTTTRLGIGTVSGNNAPGGQGDNSQDFLPPTASNSGGCVPALRVSISGTTIYYLKYLSTYAVAPVAHGRISARRVR